MVVRKDFFRQKNDALVMVQKNTFITAYDALLLAFLEHGTNTVSISAARINRGVFATACQFDVTVTCAANDASYSVAAGFVGQHLDGLRQIGPVSGEVIGAQFLAGNFAATLALDSHAVIGGERAQPVAPCGDVAQVVVPEQLCNCQVGFESGHYLIGSNLVRPVDFIHTPSLR